MEQIDELAFEKHARAGLIPYLFEDGECKFLMMVGSNPLYGGPRPMISKGKIESGENKLGAAIREAEEELGLRQSNMIGQPILLADERVILRSGTYELTVYGVLIRDKWAFDMWCDETEYTTWTTLENFRETGRRDHVKYVELLSARVR